jgi:antitoxin (DNA-binding transcriptional repressor) of toxin-antitoxin stability system
VSAVIVVNIHDAKTNFSRYLKQVENGESVLVCNRNQPIAEIRAVPPVRTELRPVGLAAGEFEVPDEFLDPLPADVLEAFGTHS